MEIKFIAVIHFDAVPKVIKLSMETSLKSQASDWLKWWPVAFQPIRCLRFETGFLSQFYNLGTRSVLVWLASSLVICQLTCFLCSQQPKLFSWLLFKDLNIRVLNQMPAKLRKNLNSWSNWIYGTCKWSSFNLCAYSKPRKKGLWHYKMVPIQTVRYYYRYRKDQ
jgi:hypothetical protein